jgi:hypothetical protein
MADEMTVPNHPHADQRNWQPGDTDDDDRLSIDDLKQLALRNRPNRLLRTFERMHKTLREIPAEAITALISPYVRIDEIVEMAQYLDEVATALGKQMQQWTCAGCGKPVWCKDDVRLTVSDAGKIGRMTNRQIRIVRPDAVYCSNACRQKAYRKRKAARYGKKTRGERKAVTKAEIVTDASLDTAA